ncbi:HesB/IscA family protein [Thiolinea disciformis]|uniref:HesB/IscA family protein n=1 Tax=Thiolinea disciformis TaxID=125614 RepID=UPI00035C8B00|nr:iron-sulfur cluster assembly accessory protein [Thiolinea disciformis]
MITITEKAANHIRKQLEKRGSGVGMRLGVKKSGCTGLMYVVDYVDAPASNDMIYENHGVKVVVDKDSLDYLKGTEIDYVRTNALNQGLEFRNPNVKDSCGCGESFNV